MKEAPFRKLFRIYATVMNNNQYSKDIYPNGVINFVIRYRCPQIYSNLKTDM